MTVCLGLESLSDKIYLLNFNEIDDSRGIVRDGQALIVKSQIQSLAGESFLKRGTLCAPLGCYRQWLILLGDLKRFDDAVGIALNADRISFFQHLQVYCFWICHERFHLTGVVL